MVRAKCGPDEDSTAIGFCLLIMVVAFIVLSLIAFLIQRIKNLWVCMLKYCKVHQMMVNYSSKFGGKSYKVV